MTNRRLYRTDHNRVIAGVASGIADYFDIDPTLVRLAFILLTITNGAGILIYIIAWIIIPEEPKTETVATAAPGERHTVGDEIDRAGRSGESHWLRQGEGGSNSRVLMGLVLIVIGLVYLVQSVFGALVWQNVWPMVLVAIGLGLVIRSMSSNAKTRLEDSTNSAQPSKGDRSSRKETPKEPS